MRRGPGDRARRRPRRRPSSPGTSPRAARFVAAVDGEACRPSAPGTGALAGGELEGQDSHADEVAAVNPLEAGGDDGANAQQVGYLWPPSRDCSRCRIPRLRARRVGPFLPHTASEALVNGGYLAVWKVAGDPPSIPAASGCGYGCWRRCPADHHPVVAASGAVAVEVRGATPARCRNLPAGLSGRSNRPARCGRW